MRTFVALELPEEFMFEVAELSRQLSSAVEGRFLSRDTYHITLAFTGDVSEGEVASIMSAMDEVVADCVPVLLRPEGLGKFGRASDATLWMGLSPNPSLMDLAERLREALDARDVAYDKKSFKPHITIARRAKIPKAGLPHLTFPRDAEATQITLFKSTLSKQGATYEPLYTAVLGN